MSATVVEQILEALGPSCRDAARRERLLAQTALNGIDFVEFELAGAALVLHVHFLNEVPAAAYGLIADASSIRVHGGTRILGVAVLGASPGGAANVLDVEVDAQGDFSPYLISIGWARDGTGAWRYAFDDVDRLFSIAAVNFRSGCPVDFDCAPADQCDPEALAEPALDYLARDYASLRQMLLDLVAQRNPTWTERSPADVGIALLELFAHEGDHLSYFQDAIANETFLDTARQRISAKRHAKLVDYHMHDGRNAWTFAHLRAKRPGTVRAATQLVTRITAAMRFDRQPGVVPVPQPVAPPGTVLNVVTDDDYRSDRALAQVRVFETTDDVVVHPLLNELRLHPWGNEQCCLARGATTVHLYATAPHAVDPAVEIAVRPPIRVGDRLLLEEVVSPSNGAPADADPTHRRVVRVVRVDPDPSAVPIGPPPADRMRDRLFLATIDPLTRMPTPVSAPVPLGDTLPLVEVTWSAEDAPDFALCLSAKLKDGTVVPNVSVARGNIAVADHGRSTNDTFDFAPPLTAETTFRLRLAEGPLTMRCAAGGALACDAREAQPAVQLAVTPTVGPVERYTPVVDLLASRPFDADFVADVDNAGRAVLRFGNGEHGRRLVGVRSMRAIYRVGNGRAGNIGADALAHVVRPQPFDAAWPGIELVRNPLPALGGEDPELIEQVRSYAPAAFRATQLRAVTEDDYRKLALTIPGVASAVASFRWTGSWYTVFVGIDPHDPELVITDARGHTRLDDRFARRVLDGLTRFRLAGYDLEIRSARYIPLDVSIQLCVAPGYFRGDVARAVSLALSAGSRPSGGRGLFDPANLGFGQPVYLSRIYAAVEDVDGVESATVTVFHPHGREPSQELANGRVPIGAWEIARLDNDPSNMENGTLTITAGGGS